VLLDDHVLPLACGLDALGRPLQLRIIAADRDHGDSAALSLEATPQSTALRPLSPVHIRAARDGDGVHVSWIRRTRIDGDSWEAQDVPLGEQLEKYQLDILSGASVMRTLETSAQGALYAAADELADFGAPQSTLSVRVAQISATVGRGIVAEAIITP
jgi:hypothetical protein